MDSGRSVTGHWFLFIEMFLSFLRIFVVVVVFKTWKDPEFV